MPSLWRGLIWQKARNFIPAGEIVTEGSREREQQQVSREKSIREGKINRENKLPLFVSILHINYN